jgi:hypothetical protein
MIPFLRLIGGHTSSGVVCPGVQVHVQDGVHGQAPAIFVRRFAPPPAACIHYARHVRPGARCEEQFEGSLICGLGPAVGIACSPTVCGAAPTTGAPGRHSVSFVVSGTVRFVSPCSKFNACLAAGPEIPFNSFRYRSRRTASPASFYWPFTFPLRYRTIALSSRSGFASQKLDIVVADGVQFRSVEIAWPQQDWN